MCVCLEEDAFLRRWEVGGGGRRQCQGFHDIIPTTSSEQQGGCLWSLIFKTAREKEVTLRHPLLLFPHYLFLISFPQLLPCFYLYVFPSLAPGEMFTVRSNNGFGISLFVLLCLRMLLATNLYKNTISHTPAYWEPPLSAGWRRPQTRLANFGKIRLATFSICFLLK